MSIRIRAVVFALLALVPDVRALTVVTFGDSTTAPRGTLRVYSDWLRSDLQFDGRDIVVHNAGAGGNTTERAKARFDRDVLARKPDLVIILFGINDAAVDVWKDPPATGPRVPPGEYRAHLVTFVRRLRDAGAGVVLMTPNPLAWSETTRRLYAAAPYLPDDPDGFNVLLRDYAAAVREVAREEGCGLVDVFTAFREVEKAPGNLTPDGMHPGEEGHRLIADRLIEHLTSGDPRYSRRPPDLVRDTLPPP